MLKKIKIKKIPLLFNRWVFFKSLLIFSIFWASIFVFTNTFFAPIFAAIPMKLTNCQQWDACYGNVRSAIVKNQINSQIITNINKNFKNIKLNSISLHSYYLSLSNNDKNSSNFHTFLTVDEGNMVPHYKISTYFFLNKNNTNKWIIMTHGIACDWTYSFLFALSFFQNYNVILYDSYGVDTNKNDSFGYYGTTGNYSTFGKYEKYGIHTLVKWIYNNHKDPKVGLFGLSMGASTSLLFLENFHDPATDTVKFVISDAAYKDAAEEMGYVGSSFVEVPSLFFTPGGSLYLSFFAGYNPYSINIIKNMKKIDKNKKLFFIQGSGDNFVPFKKNFYQLIKEAKKYNLYSSDFVEDNGTHGEDLNWNRSKLNANEKLVTKGPFYKRLNLFAMSGFGN